MTFWRAVTYRLFAGNGSPLASVTRRTVAFVLGVVLVVAIIWHYTPQLTLPYDTSVLAALVWAFSFAGVLLVGALTDACQQLFLAKLHAITLLPLQSTALRKMYMYASVPVGLVAVVLVATAVSRSFAGSMPWYYAAGGSVAACTLAAFTDILLRIVRFSSSWQPHAWRCAFIMCGVWMGYSLATASENVHTAYQAGIAGMIIAAVVLTAILTRRPIRTEYASPHLPVIEGRPGICEALSIRSLRTARYAGTNIVLAAAVVCTVMLCRTPHPVIALDGAVLLVLMLIGTLGQEVRSLSPPRYPLELLLYGAFRRWVLANWLLAYIHGLIWIDITLWSIWLWAPHSLTVSVVEAGMVGLGFIAAGMAAGSIIVPQKYDILAQCASTGLYAAFVWAFIKLSAMASDWRISPVVMALIEVAASTVIVYGVEYIRWKQTIARRIHARA